MPVTIGFGYKPEVMGNIPWLRPAYAVLVFFSLIFLQLDPIVNCLTIIRCYQLSMFKINPQHTQVVRM